MSDEAGVPPALAPWVAQCWVSVRDGPATRRRERVLPTGHAHLVLRLDGDPVQLLCGQAPQALPEAVLGGPRQHAYRREFGSASTVGLVLRPGAIERLWGVPSNRVAGQHVPLDELAGAPMQGLLDRLAAQRDPQARLQALLAWIADRLRATPRHRSLPASVAQALQRIEAPGDAPTVGQLVRSSGLSHRHFSALFERVTGMNPKAYLRVRRLNRALHHAAAWPGGAWAHIAQAAGYCDQAHLSRDFVALTGITPGQWSRAGSAAHGMPMHVPEG